MCAHLPFTVPATLIELQKIYPNYYGISNLIFYCILKLVMFKAVEQFGE